MGKRIKANLYDLVDNGIVYVSYIHVTNKEGVKGILYRLDGYLTQTQREVLAKFKNVSTGVATYKYDPRNRCDYVVIFDKCIK